jgi:hypothetical protein
MIAAITAWFAALIQRVADDDAHGGTSVTGLVPMSPMRSAGV